jgi:cAMP-dependent protein kinase regulator
MATKANPVMELEMEEEDLDMEMDEEEFQKQTQIYAGRGSVARRGVAAESISAEAFAWQPVVHPKSESQYKLIEKSCQDSLVFKYLSPENLEAVVKAFKGPVKIVKGAAVIRESERVGTNEGAFFLLEKGLLNVYKEAAGVAPPGKLAGQLQQPWCSFGEIALLYNCPRTATVVAQTESILWSLDRETFNNCVVVATQKRRKSLLDFVDSVELLRSLNGEERDKIVEVLQTRYYKAGEQITREGEEGTEFFLLERGRAIATMDGKRIKTYGPRDFFGELALVKRQHRRATVVADATPTVCAVLDADSFARVVGNFSEIMEQRSAEYEEAEVSRAAGDYEDSDVSEMDETEFQRQSVIMAKRGNAGRRAIISEKWVEDDWVAPVYKKTEIQYAMIENICLKSFLFQNLHYTNLKEMINAFKGPQSFTAGKQIFLQGAPVHSSDMALVILEKGSLEVYRAQEGEQRPGSLVTILDRVGCAFGEATLLHDTARPATVCARTDVILWSIDRATFSKCVKSFNASVREKREHFLASVELLRPISTDERNKLIDVMEVRTFNKGEYIIKKGQIGTEFFLLLEGNAVAIVNRQRVRDYGPNQYFGELALMYRQPRLPM